MLELLLKKNELESIHLLKNIVRTKSCSIDLIELKISKEKTTIRRKVHDLNIIFQTIGYPDITLLISKNTLEILNYDDQKHNNLLIDITFFFVNESPVASVVYTLLNHKAINQDTLLSDIHISESYLNKIIKKINHFLIPANLTIVSRKKYYYFTGSQVNWIFVNFLIRHFFLTMHVRSIKESKHYYCPNSIRQNLLKQSLDDYKEPFTEDLPPQISKELNDLFSIFFYKLSPQTSSPHSDQHQLLFYLFMSMSHHFNETNDDAISVGKLLHENIDKLHNNALVTDTLKITKAIAIHFDYNVMTEDYYYLSYVILIKLIKARTNIPAIEHHFVPLNSALTLNSPMEKNHFNTVTWDFPEKKLLNQMTHSLHQQPLILILAEIKQFFYLTEQIHDKLLICIKIHPEVMAATVIKDRIKQTFSNSSFLFVNSTDEADIIITDYLFNYFKTDTSIFLLESLSHKDLRQLLLFLSEKIIELNI